MLTRDSKAWFWIMLGTILTALTTNMSQVDVLISEKYHDEVHAAINLAALIVVAVAGKLSMSPLPLSSEGKMDFAQKKADKMDEASLAALDASIKSEEAVKVTSEAAEAEEVAKDVSKKADEL